MAARGVVMVSRSQMANSALLSSPAIVILLTLMERGVSSLLESSPELYDEYRRSAVYAQATCGGECV